MKRTIRMNGGNEICRSVEKSLDEYFHKLDGEQPHGIYDMVIANVERSLLAIDHACAPAATRHTPRTCSA